MIYILAAVGAVLGIWGVLIYIRKTMWDAVHQNLLDLEDAYEGTVVRRSFAARPVFSGRINDRALTVNLSTEKLAGRRLTYIDISLDKGSKVSCTISNKNWLDRQNPDKIEDYISIENKNGQEFVVRPASKKAVKDMIKQEAFQEVINDLPGMAYIFTGRSGIICELVTEDIVKAAAFENMEKNLLILQAFQRDIITWKIYLQIFVLDMQLLVGRPNAGKSTLMNSILDIKLSIISPKPQTTRRSVLGILNRKKAQVVFIDTPGILRPRYELQKKMMEHVDRALADADVILLIIDAAEKKHPQDINLKEMNRKSKPVLLLLNKIDLMPKQDLLSLIEMYSKFYPFKAVIPLSALKKDGMAPLEEELFKYLPYSPPYYPPDILTDQPERFFAAEIIRERIFHMFYHEIPYAVEVVIDEFKERHKGKDFISAIIMVERKTQKGILIGKGGESLKKIGSEARKNIKELLGKDVYLELRVKVNEDWRRKDFKLRRLGY